MFNISKTSSLSDCDILLQEMYAMNIFPSHSEEKCTISLGDELLHLESTQQCLEYIKHAVSELKHYIWQKWQQCCKISDDILDCHKVNHGGIDNLLYLSNVKKILLLSRSFSNLQHVTELVKLLFNKDIIEIDNDLIKQFNIISINIMCTHSLIMTEIYRANILNKFNKMHKVSQVAGPWANLDLPMSERAWSWTEDEDYFEERKKTRRSQARYNPEYNKNGFYYTWADYTRDPYLFTDREDNSPYRSNRYISIP